MNVRYGYIRYAGGHKPRRLGFDIKELGFSDSVAAQLTGTAALFPRIDISGLESLGYEGYDTLNNDVHSLFGDFTKQLSAHTFKFGIDARAYRDNVSFFGHATGRYQFGTNFTRGPLDNSPGSPGGVGQGLASFLLGIPTGGFIARNANEAIQSAVIVGMKPSDRFKACHRTSSVDDEDGRTALHAVNQGAQVVLGVSDTSLLHNS